MKNEKIIKNIKQLVEERLHNHRIQEKKSKKEEEEEEEKDEKVEDEDMEDIEDIDTEFDMDLGDNGGEGDIDVKQNANTDLSGTIGKVQDNLEAALNSARALGDEKLTDQIGNTLTFFTRSHVVKEVSIRENRRRRSSNKNQYKHFKRNIR